MGHTGQEVMKTSGEQTHLNTSKIWWNGLSIQRPDLKDNRYVSVLILLSLVHKSRGKGGTLFNRKAKLRASWKWGRLFHLHPQSNTKEMNKYNILPFFIQLIPAPSTFLSLYYPFPANQKAASRDSTAGRVPRTGLNIAVTNRNFLIHIPRIELRSSKP
jgi:hypothetical protein